MSVTPLLSRVRHHRHALGLSQQALAERVGVSRQAILAIESGRQVPSTRVSLLLARALRCRVEELFALPQPDALAVHLAPTSAQDPWDAPPVSRVVLGQVRDRWVAHRMAPGSPQAADGVLLDDGTHVEPLAPLEVLAEQATVAGCAPLLGLLQDPSSAVRPARWIPSSSGRALDLLAEGLVHVAGVHLLDADGHTANVPAVRARLPDQEMVVVNLTRWRQGLVLPPGNPLGISDVADLLQPGLRLASRGAGAGATKLLKARLPGPPPPGPFARGHAEVAQLVRVGAADAGVAIEAVALALGLDFLPLAEERFDLVIPRDLLQDPAVARLLDAIAGREFRADASRMPGYDLDLAGDTTPVEAA